MELKIKKTSQNGTIYSTKLSLQLLLAGYLRRGRMQRAKRITFCVLIERGDSDGYKPRKSPTMQGSI